MYLPESYIIKGIDPSSRERYFYQDRHLNEPLKINPKGLDLSVPNAVFGDDPEEAKRFVSEQQALNKVITIHDGSKLLKIERKM